MNKLWMNVNNMLFSNSVDAEKLLNDTSNNNQNVEQISNTVQGIGGGGLNVMTTLLVYGAAIGFVIGAFMLIVNAGNPNKVSDAKQALIWRVIGAVLGFAAVGLVVWAQSVGNGLFA